MHPLPSVALAGLMMSELSAGCECRLFGTGLVMSQTASDYTQNAAFRDRKLNNFLVKGHSPLHRPLPHWGGGHPSPNPTPLGAYGARPPLSSFAPPPNLTLLATGLVTFTI